MNKPKKKNTEAREARANKKSHDRERGEGESQSEQKGRLVLGLGGHFSATLHSVKILLTLRLTAFDQVVCQRPKVGAPRWDRACVRGTERAV